MPESNEELYSLIVHGRPHRTVAADDVIFREGDEADGMFVITSGTVALKRGDEVVAKVDGPSLIGEMALVDSEPRLLTAVAATEIDIVHIPVRHFWVLVHETPYFARLVMSVMSQRLRTVGQTT